MQQDPITFIGRDRPYESTIHDGGAGDGIYIGWDNEGIGVKLNEDDTNRLIEWLQRRKTQP